MRYQPAHAAKSGSDPFSLRGPKSARTILSAATAGILGLVPTVMVSSPAMADTNGTITVTATTASVPEGGNLVFTIQNNTGIADSLVLSQTGTATPGTDFTAPSTPLAIGANATEVVTIPTAIDNNYEGANETVIFKAVGATATNFGVATGTIVDADAAPTYALSASPNPVTEAASTTTVTATLTKKSSTNTVIAVSTADGTARAGFDYMPLSGYPLTVTAGQLTATTTVNILADAISDTAALETFTVNSASAGTIQPTNAAAGSTTVSIQDAETTPEVSITGGGAVTEGSPLVIPVTLTPASEKEVKVDWESVTPVGTPVATAGTDFTYPSTRTVTIPAGQTSSTITIQTLKDNVGEDPENFQIQLTNPQNATLDQANLSVSGQITTGMDAPKVTIAPTSVTEGNSGRQAATFTATLSAASTQTVRVNWATAPDGTPGIGKALPGTDYVSKSGGLTFAPGVTTQTFKVEIIGDTIDEASTAGVQSATDGETFLLALTAPSGAAFIDLSDPGSNRPVKILDDDAAPTVIFADKTQAEGNEAAAWLMPVMLSNGSDTPIGFTVAPAGSGNTADDVPLVGGPGGDDYALLGGVVTIPAGQTSAYPVLLVNGDTINEADEFANLTATPDVNPTFLASATAKTAKVTLTNDDALPNFEVNDISGMEGDTVAVTGTVIGTRQGAASVKLAFAGGSSGGSTAASVDDFDNPGVKTITIAWGTLDNTVVSIANVPLLTDTVAESDETILVTGSSPDNTATVTDGVITIEGSEGPAPSEDLTLKSTPSTRVGAGSVVLSGMGAAGASVTLSSQPYNGTAWTEGETKTASGTGAYSFTANLTTTGMRYKVTSGDAVSNTVAVILKQDPDFYVRSSVKGKATLTVFGDPRVAGLVAKFYRVNANGSMTTLSVGTLDANGKYYRTFPGLKSGSTYRYKTTVYGVGTRGLVSGTSATKSLKIM
jgi:hypothetical protein